MRPHDIAALLAVPLAAGLLFLGGGAASEPEDPQAARTVPVSQTMLACPPLETASSDPDSLAATVVSPRLGGAPELPVQPVLVDAGRRQLAQVEQRGQSWSGTAPSIADGLDIGAEGGLAAGLTGAVGGVFDDGARGLATAPCPQPASHWWFVGAASAAERSGRLHLANPSPGVAVVDLAFYGEDGPVEAAGAQGLAIAPGKTRTVPLADLVPGVGPVSVEVTTHQGQVAASLTEVERDVLDPGGVEMVPPASEPGTTSVLTGIPPGPGRHTLSVMNGGEGSAVVEVEVLGERGAFTPSSLESVQVPAHGVVEEPLSPRVLGGKASGVRLVSDQPVTAAVRTTSGSPLQDQAYAVSAEPLPTKTVTPVLRDLDGEVVLSSSGRAAVTVDMTTISADGKTVATRTVDLRGGQTGSLEIPPRGQAAAVRLRATGVGRLVGAALWADSDSGGDLISGFPLTPPRLTVQRPPVEYTLAQP